MVILSGSSYIPIKPQLQGGGSTEDSSIKIQGLGFYWDSPSSYSFRGFSGIEVSRTWKLGTWKDAQRIAVLFGALSLVCKSLSKFGLDPRCPSCGIARQLCDSQATDAAMIMGPPTNPFYYPSRFPPQLTWIMRN